MKNKINTLFIILLGVTLSNCSSNPSHTMSTIKNPLPECPSTPNCVRKAISVEGDSSTTFSAVEEALEKIGAESIKKEESKLRIDAIFKIPIFGYRDDVAVLVEPKNESSTIFIRSASREGHWDIFVNSIRVRRIINQIQKQLSE
ncbi:MAG: DUF1499 domain-containing protein [Balneolaceae bacterium]|nr:DUF1499 domain-containing protein [Balneolaceae bacterium]MBO6648220.1 DUF1499 domain-containing protein [Balneolaceae bacterium]